MLGGDGVTVDFLALEVTIDGVEIEAVSSRKQAQYFLKILAELSNTARFARVVASDSEASAERAGVGFKATYVIALPAVQRDGGAGEGCECLFYIDA